MFIRATLGLLVLSFLILPAAHSADETSKIRQCVRYVLKKAALYPVIAHEILPELSRPLISEISLNQYAILLYLDTVKPEVAVEGAELFGHLNETFYRPIGYNNPQEGFSVVAWTSFQSTLDRMIRKKRYVEGEKVKLDEWVQKGEVQSTYDYLVSITPEGRAAARNTATVLERLLRKVRALRSARGLRKVELTPVDKRYSTWTSLKLGSTQLVTLAHILPAEAISVEDLYERMEEFGVPGSTTDLSEILRTLRDYHFVKLVYGTKPRHAMRRPIASASLTDEGETALGGAFWLWTELISRK